MCIIDCLSTIVFILPLHLDYTKVIILILWRRTFQLEYWRTFQLVSTPIPLFPYKKHRQAGNYRHSGQYHLNLATCFRLAIVKEPQRTVELPMTRSFPTEQQSCKPEGKQRGCEQQSVFRMSLRPLEKRFCLAVHSFVYIGNRHTYN